MKDNYVKKTIFVMFVLAILGAVCLYFLSDNRIEAAKRVSYVFDVDISKNATRDKEIYKEPSFHGDGISAVKLIVPNDEAYRIESELSRNKNLRKLDDTNGYVKSDINYVREKGMPIGYPEEYEIYAKSKNKGTSEVEYFANHYLLLICKNKGELIFIESDT